MDTPDHGYQMRHEGQPYRLAAGLLQGLSDLGQMTMPGHRIGLEALAHFTHQHRGIGAPAGPADA